MASEAVTETEPAMAPAPVEVEDTKSDPNPPQEELATEASNGGANVKTATAEDAAEMEEEEEEEEKVEGSVKEEEAKEKEKEKVEGEEGEEKSGPVSLGPKMFGSAMEMFDYFYKILHFWPPNVEVNKYEFMVLLDLIKKGHPEPEKKIGAGVKAFQIRYHPTWKSRCFFLIRTDESVEDFSFRKCVDHILPLPEEIKLKPEVDKALGGGRGRGGGRGGGRGRGRGKSRR